MAVPLTPNRRWPLDFISDQLTDDLTRECLALLADTSLSGGRAVCGLATLFNARGKPGTVVGDNGTNFTLNVIRTFAEDRKIDRHYIAPEKPMQNAFIKSINGRLR